jgi:hypothetical protein
MVPFCQFKTKGGSQLKEYCTNLTKEDCRRQTGSFVACDKVSVNIVLVSMFSFFIPLLKKKHVPHLNAITSVEIQFVHLH